VCEASGESDTTARAPDVADLPVVLGTAAVTLKY
jgi:hypothetical protein